MTRKLIAPRITGGDWFPRGERKYSNVVNSIGQQVCWCGDAIESRGDAIFLAGSKRVAEAAAAWLNVWARSGGSEAVFADEFARARDELRAALIASGYREE